MMKYRPQITYNFDTTAEFEAAIIEIQQWIATISPLSTFMTNPGLKRITLTYPEFVKPFP